MSYLNKTILRTINTVLLFSLIFSAGCSALKQGPDLYYPLKNQLENVLDTAGSNKAQINLFLNAFNDNPEKRQSAKFIAANLPPCDSTTISSGLLIENLEYSFLAKDSTAWGRDVAWSDFQNYVLPHRVSQESAVKWRKLFYQELLPTVSDCKNIEEAVLAVNLWCFSKTGFKSTQRWDQNPLMTINRGWGRCEEAVIFTVSALRSVGIPARQAMAPAWQHSNDNHTWTEVLINGKWHYLESANPDYGLDHAWFTGSVRKAPLVISYAYGNVPSPKFPVLGKRVGCTLLNTTAMYAPASRTKILVTDNNKTPLAGVKVYFSVFNYASFRPVAAKETGINGEASILLGPGSVLVSANHDNATAYLASTWIPGEQDARRDIHLQLLTHNDPSGEVLFRFDYKDDLAKTAPAKNSEGARKSEFEKIKKARIDKLDGMKSGAEKFDESLGSYISKAGLNTPEILSALSNSPESSKKYLADIIRKMEIADLIQIKADELISNVNLAIAARDHIAKSGITYSDDLFVDYVLNPRVMYEHLEPWRASLAEHFTADNDKNYEQTIARINRFTQKIQKAPRGPIGASITPLGVLNSKRASGRGEIGVFTVAALRSVGIPAKYLDEQGWVEFYNGQKWTPLYPQRPNMIGNHNATETSTTYYSNWGSYKFTLPGFPAGERHPQYFKDFTISNLTDNSFFQIVEKTINGKCSDKNIWEISLPNNEYYLISGKRNKKGEPSISIIPLKSDH
ncbi:transglutaminase-like domain-containing protein [Maridesulfovibrio frigidus]|uniref:transglutaminase-like domain-containing protein n=1 Tax=Maridesulfovibrio frigidus TaxID=340956 RepID=UPI0004E2389B|nr:transglutaminase-like domain-containing protein [Maridesulfovibrio frigidus]